jgi:lactate dehydrogenase-like 2-hydroxyacid dehydrogenase
LKNVVATPRLAWLTRETLERSIDAALKNLDRLRTGLSLENRVA